MSNIHVDKNHWTYRVERISKGLPARIGSDKVHTHASLDDLEDDLDGLPMTSLEQILLDEIEED